MTDAAQDQGWNRKPFDLHAMLQETKRLVDEARAERIRRQSERKSERV